MATSQSSKSAWQISKSSLKERNKHMFNNSLISDVTFSVNNSSAHQQQSVLLIPAHKYVLAISSPVFFAMFYGHMADAARTVELADCDSDSFLELLRFVYCDEAELTGRNVIQVLYLAKKYMIPALSEKCTRFLQENLDANNVFAVLPGVQPYGEEACLIKQCWNVVDKTAEEAMHSEAFFDISHELLKAVLKRDSLTAREVDIFEAVDRWAVHQCEKADRHQISGDEKRKTVGDAIHLVRFPVMKHETFAATVPKTELLSKEEMCDLFLHFHGAKESTAFSEIERTGDILARISRLNRQRSHVTRDSWYYAEGCCDALAFSASCDVSIHGVRLYGSPGGGYSVTVGIYRDETKLTEETGTFVTEKATPNRYNGYDVLFKKPADVKKDVKYEVRAVIKGPSSDCGNFATSESACDNVSFSFYPSKSSTNSTSPSVGQFPEILFIRREKKLSVS